MRNFLHFLLCTCLLLAASCSGYKNESELDSEPGSFTGDFRIKPGEKLRYRAFMGPIRLGDLELKVDANPDTIRGKIAWCIRADGKSAGGFSWLSVVEHHWESWVDTANGLSLKTKREARENRYRVSEELEYFPDSNLILNRNLKKNEIRRFSSRPENMQDLLNLTWKLRYTKFDQYKTGDTLRYVGFHDGEWLAFRVWIAGKTILGKGKNKQEVFELVPVGLATTFLRGENPARIWIENSGSRRPVKARLATYFGNFTVNLIE